MTDQARPHLGLPGWAPTWLAGFLSKPVPSFCWRLFTEITRVDVSGLSAEMAYRFLFALFPFLIFLAALVGYIGAIVGSEDLFQRVMDLLAVIFPTQVQQVLQDWVEGVLSTQSPGLLTVGAAAALWAAAGGVGTLVKGLNRAYDQTESRSFWVLQGLALLTTVALALLMLGGVVAFTIGQLAVSWAVEHLGVDPRIWFWWNLIKGPGLLLALGIVFAVTYALLPNQRLSLYATWPGAVFATLAWLLLTSGFGWYVSHLASYDRTFGSLGAAVVLMVWMYAVSAILLIGGIINALLEPERSVPGSERRATGQERNDT